MRFAMEGCVQRRLFLVIAAWIRCRQALGLFGGAWVLAGLQLRAGLSGFRPALENRTEVWVGQFRSKQIEPTGASTSRLLCSAQGQLLRARRGKFAGSVSQSRPLAPTGSEPCRYISDRWRILMNAVMSCSLFLRPLSLSLQIGC